MGARRGSMGARGGERGSTGNGAWEHGPRGSSCAHLVARAEPRYRQLAATRGLAVARRRPIGRRPAGRRIRACRAGWQWLARSQADGQYVQLTCAPGSSRSTAPPAARRDARLGCRPASSHQAVSRVPPGVASACCVGGRGWRRDTVDGQYRGPREAHLHTAKHRLWHSRLKG